VGREGGREGGKEGWVNEQEGNARKEHEGEKRGGSIKAMQRSP
jgi:hypothetical protein